MPIPETLAPAAVWREFAAVCAIPHPSGHEEKLASFLADRARAAGLSVRRDAAGNLRIDRPAAPGWPRNNQVILQAHLDMVPQKLAGLDFDFLRDPIRTVVDGDFVRSCGTTLGADDGIGIALAMTLLLDKDFRCGAVSGLFTVGEETKMVGASALTREMLEGTHLVNLDYDEAVCTGCAGGVNTRIRLPLPRIPARGIHAYEFIVDGLPGGHSGTEIDKNRGNALLRMAKILRRLPVSIAELSGGDVANAIPCRCTAKLVSTEPHETLLRMAEGFRPDSVPPLPAATLHLRGIPMPDTVWAPEFQRQFLDSAVTLPNGPLAFDTTYNVVRTSSNFAALHETVGELHLLTSQRSLNAAELRETAQTISRHFTLPGAASEISDGYPPWDPQSGDPEFTALVERELGKRLGRTIRAEVIHAGLECGLLSGLRPELPMVSVGPEMHGAHTPEERLSISSVGKINAFLRNLLEIL